MWKLISILLLIKSSSTTTQPIEIENYIVGGTEVDIKNYPWQVSLQISGKHACGGTIYNELSIISSANCLKQTIMPSMIHVRAGSSYHNKGGSLLQVTSFKIHENFNPLTMANDIAMVFLAVPLRFGLNIKPIALSMTSPINGACGVVTGWGATAFGSNEIHSTLEAANVRIIEQSVCASSNYGYGNLIEATMICALETGKDACQFDGGGPLVSHGVLVGLVSWGFGCAYAYYPGVYVNVSKYRAWILSEAKTFSTP